MSDPLVLATQNQDKKDEIKHLLSGLGISLRTLDYYPDVPVVIEDGDTCEENAIKKAVEILI